MRKLTIGDVTITSIIERDGPWRFLLGPGQARQASRLKMGESCLH